jgi:Transposase, Mutator family
MTTTLNDVTARKRAEPSAEEQAAAELVRQAKERGLSPTGPDGLLKQLTKTVLETALNEELTEHLGSEKHDPVGVGTTRQPHHHGGGAERDDTGGELGHQQVQWWARPNLGISNMDFDEFADSVDADGVFRGFR